MTTVAEVLARAARQCSVTAPSSWITATADEHVEIRDDFLLETVDDIAERVDLPSPISAQTTIAGDGSETYDLPANFRRLHRDAYAVYDTYLDRPVLPVTTDGNWTYLQDLAVTGTDRFYKVTGYEGDFDISFYGFPSASVSITVSYVTRNWLINSGTAGYTFTDEDNDTMLLPRRVVEAGIVWRFRERKGIPYQDKYMEYEAMVARLSNDTRGRREVRFGHTKPVRWQDIVPPYIPSS